VFVRNPGGSDAPSSTLTDFFPQETTGVAALEPGCVITTTRAVCGTNFLPPDASQGFRFVVQVDYAPTQAHPDCNPQPFRLFNQAFVNPVGGEQQGGNNAAILCTSVTGGTSTPTPGPVGTATPTATG